MKHQYKQVIFDRKTFPYRFTSKYSEPRLRENMNREWKLLMAEEKIRNKKYKKDKSIYHEDHVGPLTILRNLLLNRDVHTGFTPNLSKNQIENGKSWNHGWYHAYDSLKSAFKDRRFVGKLTIKCYRLILSSCYHNFDPQKLIDYLPEARNFWGNNNLGNYFSTVNQTLGIHLEFDPALKSKLKTYQDVIDHHEAIEKYNVMTKEQFLERDHGYTKFSNILKQFAHDWLMMTNRAKDHILDTVSIEEASSISWLYNLADNDDISNHWEANSLIKIVTKSRKTHIIGTPGCPILERDLIFYLPVKYLWEIDWMEDEPRV